MTKSILSDVDVAAGDPHGHHGWARLCQVVGNFFGGSLSVGIGRHSDDDRMSPGDNGIYVIDGWRIVERVLPYDGFVEQDEYGFDEMLRAFDEPMPEDERLGDFLDAAEVPASELSLGDEVWVLLESMHFSPQPQLVVFRLALTAVWHGRSRSCASRTRR